MAVYTSIDNPELYFQTKLYTGTGDDDLAITLDGDENMQPDMVWIKERNDTGHTLVYDAVRGATKEVYTNLTNAESTNAATLKSFDSDGFTLGTGGGVNTDDNTHVAWCWKESADAGFDIVSFTGNITNRTISHSLSAVPHVLLTKNREASEAWVVYHSANTSAPETDYLVLNTNAATVDGNTTWNDTAPTSSVFTVSTSPAVNGDGEGMIAYLWSEKQGFSKFGGYTGNGNASDGTFVYTGFRPALVLVKATSRTGDWYLMDNKRDTINSIDLSISANSSNADNNQGNFIDFLSNGFKLYLSGFGLNESGATYIYMAFAEQPFVNSNGVPCNAR